MSEAYVPETYSPAEAALILGIGKSTMLAYIKKGIVPAIRLGGQCLVPRAYVDRLFADAGCPREAVNGPTKLDPDLDDWRKREATDGRR